VKVRREDVEKVIEGLRELGGVEESPPPGVKARFKFKGGVVNVYGTGSITVGGKEREGALKAVEAAVSKAVKRELPVVGCDEAGKGELFGPLVVACVWADEECYRELLKLGVKDSKRIKREKLEELADKIKRVCRGRVRVLMPAEYNALYEKFKNQNRLLEAVYLELLRELLKKRGAKEVVIDKFSPRIGELASRELKVPVKAVKGGEDEPVVAAAAIVAKAERLKRMRELSNLLGRELPEGNAGSLEFLKELPKELKHRFVKEHFKSGEEE